MSIHCLRFAAFMASLVCFASCSSSTRNSARLDDSPVARPSIYDAWDARYKYDSGSRKMVPVYNGKVVGKTWSRDADGQLNYSAYLGRTQDIDEDLFPLHLAKLDRKRDKQWEENKQKRMEDVGTMLRILEEDKKEPMVEIMLEDEEEDEFIPSVFMPSGIDMAPADAPSLSPFGEEAESSDNEISPFLPLP